MLALKCLDSIKQGNALPSTVPGLSGTPKVSQLSLAGRYFHIPGSARGALLPIGIRGKMVEHLNQLDVRANTGCSEDQGLGALLTRAPGLGAELPWSGL